jgi:glucosyl-3-phosphoglycerate synthase
MSDFAQNETICTLQGLNEKYLQEIDQRILPEVASATPITLVLPCHGVELKSPALQNVCKGLSKAGWLHEVLVPMNGLSAEEFCGARTFFSKTLKVKHRLIHVDAPPSLEALSYASNIPVESMQSGKGLNVWAALGIHYAERTSGILAFQDADVVSFNRTILARMCLACAKPKWGFDFVKMYYSRATDRLYGRVSRLFLSPLLHALIEVCGHLPLLDFLRGFRYPLSGECAMSASLAGTLEFEAGWGLEIGMLAEVFRKVDPVRIAQVDGGSGYDHKHQPAEAGLEKMCIQIASTLLRQLLAEGCRLDARFVDSLSRSMETEFAEAVRRSEILAQINGFAFELAPETALSEMFRASVPPILSGIQKPAAASARTLPSWQSVERLRPDALRKLVQ